MPCRYTLHQKNFQWGTLNSKHIYDIIVKADLNLAHGSL